MKPATLINYRLMLGGVLVLFVCGQTGWIGSPSMAKLSPQAGLEIGRKQQDLSPYEELIRFLQQAEGGNGARLRKIVTAFVGSRKIPEIERILSEKDPGVRPKDVREFFDNFNEKRLRRGLNDTLERTQPSGFIRRPMFVVKSKNFQDSLQQLINEVKRLRGQEVDQMLQLTAGHPTSGELVSVERVLTGLFNNGGELLGAEQELLNQFFTQYRQLLTEAQRRGSPETTRKAAADLLARLTALEQSVQWRKRQGQQETIRRAVLSNLSTLEEMLSQKSRERLEADFRAYQDITHLSPAEVIRQLGDPNPLFEVAFEEKNRIARLLAQASSEDSNTESERLLVEANQKLATIIGNIRIFQERFAKTIEGARTASIRDAYDTLGLVEGTPPETVKKEFKRQILKVHPDKVRARLRGQGIPDDQIGQHPDYRAAIEDTTVLTKAYDTLISRDKSNKSQADETTVSTAL